MFSFLEDTSKTVQYILLWLAFAIILTIVFYSIVALPVWMILIDSVMHALIFGLLGLLLWNVVKYGNFHALTVYQRMVNHVALAFLSIAIWLSGGYGLFLLIFGADSASQFIPFLPIRGFIGLLVYLLIVQHFRFLLNDLDSNVITSDLLQVVETEKQKTQNTEVLERIAVKSGAKIHVVLVTDIFFLQADGDYVQIFTVQGKYLKEQTMKFFEEHLPENQFVRVHRSVIVNVEMISRIELYEKQNQLLTLKNGQQIKTSSSGYKALRMALNL